MTPPPTQPHKPLFLLAGLWALVAPLVWVWPGPTQDPVSWHLHEFFFGMAAAAIGGYLLTALPHRAGKGIGPAALRLLVLAWEAGRVAQVWPSSPHPVFLVLPHPALLVLLLSYPLMLGLLLAIGLLRARAWTRLWMAALPFALAGAEVVWVTADPPGPDPLALVLGFSLMIGLVGGRIVPAFTRSRICRAAPGLSFRDGRMLGWFAALSMATGLILLSQVGAGALSGGPVLIAGLLHALRLVGWRPLHMAAQADIAMMQIAVGWLALGQALVGVALIVPEALRVQDALHALTMGAMGGMILAIAARPLLPRRAGRLQTPPDILLAFVLLCAATALRVARPELLAVEAIPVATFLWTAAWGLYVMRALRCWGRPAPFPVLSADRRCA